MILDFEVIKLEFILRLKIKRNDWLLADTCPQAANHCALFWVWDCTQGRTWFTCLEYAFYSGQTEFQSSMREQLRRSCSEYTTVRGGVVGEERSRDQTKMAERLNGRETSTNISFRTRPFPVLSRYQARNCYFCRSWSRIAIFVYCFAHVLAYLIHRVTTEYAEMFCLTLITSSSGSTLNTQNSMNQVRPRFYQLEARFYLDWCQTSI